MSNNISILSTEEEKQIWFEVFPEFINQLKKHIIATNHFNIISDGENYCKLVLNQSTSIEINIGDELSTPDSIHFKAYTVSIELMFFQKKRIRERTIFGRKEKIEIVNANYIIYPLHLTPPNVTSDSEQRWTSGMYFEAKEKYINQNIENFINLYNKEKYYFEYSFDIFSFLINLQEFLEKFYTEKIKNENIKRKEKLEVDKKSILLDLDKDNNGEVDLVDAESFNKLLTKNQQSIIEIDKNYIQKFIKISMYLKLKKINTQKIFESIKDTNNDAELNELMHLLNNQIHTYELLVFHSISMVTSLVDSDLITFYEIYECFDQLGVFNSNWENEVSNKLNDISDGIRDLMYSIYHMENKIVRSIDNLTYVTQESFSRLNHSVNNQLSSIDSSIKFNNLLTGIQTYQMYKINQNTKGLEN